MREYHTFKFSDDVIRTPVKYKNHHGVTVAGELYVPRDLDTSARYPAMVVSPSCSDIKEQGSEVYANQLAEQGFVVLTFNGERGGSVRRVSFTDVFSEDLSAGVDFLETLTYVRREQIGVIAI